MIDLKKTYAAFQVERRSFVKSLKRSTKKKIIKLSMLGGSLGAFMVALMFVFVWVLCGPYFNFSDTWQLVINTGTTIVTFLMAFSIQFSQNRDTKEIKLILRSLMKQNEDLRNQLAAIEKEIDEEDE